MATWAWVWVLILIAAGLVELATTTLVSIWFCGGAIAALIAMALGASGGWQVAVFILTSALAFGISWPLVRRRKQKQSLIVEDKDFLTNLDRYAGRIVILAEAVDNIKGTGSCVLNGQHWCCRTEDPEEEIPAGSKVVVVAVRGSMLIVRSYN